jgi:WhiA LAGLIDADG-like domain/WhiA C-terminal HTH domain
MTGRPDRGGSFTAEILAELTPHTPPLPCCRAALVDGMARVGAGGESEVVTTRLSSARAALKALHGNGVVAHVERVAAPRHAAYRVAVQPVGDGEQRPQPSQRACCARSRLRGAFLGAGTVARPDGPPHLEILCRSEADAAALAAEFAAFAVPATALRRRGRWLVAVRSAEAVGSALSTIGAQSGRLRFEDGRVVRELRASVNRRLNAETANLRRTVEAGMDQLAAIAALRADARRWQALQPALREAAVLRERHPQDTLDALARSAACSRSAMADRLRRLVDSARPLLS